MPQNLNVLASFRGFAPRLQGNQLCNVAEKKLVRLVITWDWPAHCFGCAARQSLICFES